MYIIKRDRKLYFGYTNDLARRFKQHSKNYRCTMVYYEAYMAEKLARQRELALKQYGGAWRALRGRLGIKKGGVIVF